MRKFVSALLAICMLFCLSSCADLGEYDNEDKFFSSFGKINLVMQSDTDSPDIVSVILPEFSGSEAVKENKTLMDEEAYKYVFFQVKTDSDLTMDDLSLWFLSQTFGGKVMLEIYRAPDEADNYRPDKNQDKSAGCYICETKTGTGIEEQTVKTYLNFDGYGKVDDGKGHKTDYTLTKDGIKYKTSFSLEYKEDEGGSEVSYNLTYTCSFDALFNVITVEIYDNVSGTSKGISKYNYYEEFESATEAGLTDKIGEATITVKQGVWSSVYFDKWTDAKSDTVKVNTGAYIYIKILNNCSGAFRKGLDTFCFKTNNLMIRSV